jgi:hypothetical protein
MDEDEALLFSDVLDELNKILGNPTGVSATEVTALRDRVAAALSSNEDEEKDPV